MTESKKQQTATHSDPCHGFFKKHLSAIPARHIQLIFWPIVIAGVILDLWSKKAVFQWLEQKAFYRVSIIDGLLQIVRAENAGAAFGIASGQRHFLVAVSIIALIAILAIFFFTRIEHKIIYIALALFTAGVCGNLYDRIYHNGLVRDFIDVYYGQHHWPAFNVADSMLCIGMGIMIILSFVSGKPAQKPPQQQK